MTTEKSCARVVGFPYQQPTRALGRRPIGLLLSSHHDPQRLDRQWQLQRPRFIRGRRSQMSGSSSVVRITGIAFGWIGATTALAAVVKKP
jgi:hypothetical protein